MCENISYYSMLKQVIPISRHIFATQIQIYGRRYFRTSMG